jgi:hypothetical protein
MQPSAQLPSELRTQLEVILSHCILSQSAYRFLAGLWIVDGVNIVEVETRFYEKDELTKDMIKARYEAGFVVKLSSLPARQSIFAELHAYLNSITVEATRKRLCEQYKTDIVLQYIGIHDLILEQVHNHALLTKS